MSDNGMCHYLMQIYEKVLNIASLYFKNWYSYYLIPQKNPLKDYHIW